MDGREVAAPVLSEEVSSRARMLVVDLPGCEGLLHYQQQGPETSA